MCGKGGSTNTVEQQSQPPPQFMQAYSNLLTQGNNVASQPLQQYGGPMVAGFTPDQANAFSQVEDASGVSSPFYNTAAQYAAQGAAPSQIQQFSQGAVDQYQNPYTQDVINSTMANINQQNQLQQQGLLSQGIRSGNAFGGDRAGLAQAALTNQQNLASGQTIAGLESQGYGTALGELNTQQQTQLAQQSNDAARAAQASYQFGNIGQGIQGSALTGANALLNTGQQQQALAQQQLNVPYGQFTQQQAYPFQTTNFLAGLTSGLGSQAGGSSSTTGPGASQLGQYLGLGQLGLGAFNAFGSGAGAASGLGSLGAISGASGASDAAAMALPFLARGGSVPHYDVGGQTGLPGDPMSMGVPLAGITKGIPNIGALSYLQPINVHGSGPPKAPNIPHVDQNQQLASNVKAAQNLVSGIGKDVNQQQQSQPSDATNYVNNTLQQTNPQPILPQPDDTSYARGGGIPHYAMGGAMQGLGLANAFGNLTGNRTGPMNTAMGNASISNMLTPHMADGGGLVGYLPSATGIPTPQINPNAFNFNPNITGSSGGVGNTPQMPPWAQGLGGGNMMPGMQGGGNQMPPWQGGQGNAQMPHGNQNGFLPPWLTQNAPQGQQMPSNGSPPPQGGTFANNASASSMPQGPGSLYVGPPTQQYGQPTPNMQPQKIGSGYDSIYALPQIPLSAMPNPNTVYTTGSIPPPGLASTTLQGASASGGLGGGGAGGMFGYDYKRGGAPHFDEAGAVIPDGASPALDPSLPVPQDANAEAKPQRDMTPYQLAIHSVESADQKDPYGAVGPQTKSGDRALGKYQVMAQNVPQWTAEALGKPMNASEFLHNPQAQDAVFNHRFGKYLDQYGTPQDAASMWFAGKPLSQAGNASDGYTTTPQYVSGFMNTLNKVTQGGAQAYADQSPGLAGAPASKAIASSSGSGNGLGSQQPVGDEDLDPHPMIDHSGATSKIRFPSTGEELDTGLPGQKTWKNLFTGTAGKDVGMALMQSGFATMAAASRPGATALGSIGAGGMQGLSSYQQQQKETSSELHQREQERHQQAIEQQGNFAITPGQGAGPDGQTTWGTWLTNRKTGEMSFRPDVLTGKGAASPSPTSDLFGPPKVGPTPIPQPQPQGGAPTPPPQPSAQAPVPQNVAAQNGIPSSPLNANATQKPVQVASLNPEDGIDPTKPLTSDQLQKGADYYAQKQQQALNIAQQNNHAPGTNPEVLNNLSKNLGAAGPGMAATIKAVAEGRQSLTSVPSRNFDLNGQKVSARQIVEDGVNLYMPGWEQSNATLRANTIKDLAPNGTTGKLVLGVNQLIPHLATLSNAASELDNGNYPVANKISNWLATQTGDPRVIKFNSIRDVAALDAARILRGAGAFTEKEIEHWRDNISAASSPAQLNGVINTLATDLMGARVNSIRSGYKILVGKDAPDLLSDEAKQGLQTIQSRDPTTKGQPKQVQQNGHVFNVYPDGSHEFVR